MYTPSPQVYFIKYIDIKLIQIVNLVILPFMFRFVNSPYSSLQKRTTAHRQNITVVWCKT